MLRCVVRSIRWALVVAACTCYCSAGAQIGIFTGEADIGTVLHLGSAHFDPANGTYTITGSGENMWFGTDDFHYVWTKAHGDVALTADISFVGTGGDNHRKAVLLIRQTLDRGSPYVDVARHGDGLTSLQYRDTPDADTHEVESNLSAPQRVRIEKRGDYFYVFVSNSDGRLVPSGAAMRLKSAGDFYVGLGVCAHNKNVTETAKFSNVKLETLPPNAGQPVLYSALETVTIASTDRRVAYIAPAHFEAPNWSRDGASLIFNQDGLMRQIAVGGSAPTPISTGSETHCNNDHGLSPDGSLLAISDQSAADGRSRIYVLPAAGGAPRQVTPDGPSYWHGWSPDGKTLAFTGERSGEFDIYAVSVAGGKETRLTTAKGLDDGPEYSPDGASIYFNSERSGSMQIWRMNADGSSQDQASRTTAMTGSPTSRPTASGWSSSLTTRA